MPKVEMKVNALAPQEIREAIARKMAAAVIFMTNYHQDKLNISNPFPHLTPSKPGEYPRKRTGFLQKSVTFSPDSIPEIARTMRIRVGYDANAFYGPRLEIMMKRLGLVKTLKDCAPMMAKILGMKMKVS